MVINIVVIMETTITFKTRFNIHANEIDDVEGAIQKKINSQYEKCCHENSYVIEIINIVKRGPTVAFSFSTEGLMTVDAILEARVKRYTKGDIIPISKITINDNGTVLSESPGLYITLDKMGQIMHGAKTGDLYPIKVKKADYIKYYKDILVIGKRYTKPTHTTIYVAENIDTLTPNVIDEVEYYISEIKRYSLLIVAGDKKLIEFLDDVLFHKNNIEYPNYMYPEQLYKDYGTLTNGTAIVKYPTLINRNTKLLMYHVESNKFNQDVKSERINPNYKTYKKTLKGSTILIKLLRYQLSLLVMIAGIIEKYPTIADAKTNANAWNVIQNSRDLL